MSSPEILVLSNSATEKEQAPAWLAGTEPDASRGYVYLIFLPTLYYLHSIASLTLLPPFRFCIYSFPLPFFIVSSSAKCENSMIEIYRNKSFTTLFTLPPSFVFWLHSAFTVSVQKIIFFISDYIFHLFLLYNYIKYKYCFSLYFLLYIVIFPW